MTRLLKPLLFSVALALGAAVVYAQGPLTAWANLGGRTDANGYLLTSAGAYAAPDGPLTPMANLRVRTDANGYLITSSTGSPTFTGPIYAPDGTALLPAYSFTSEPTLGFWRSAAAIITVQGGLTVTGSVLASGDLRSGSVNSIFWTGRAVLQSPVNGVVNVTNQAVTTGAQLKVDALPTIASGFGTSPAVTAGSTPLAGSVNVGTGAPGTGGVLNWAGTAFPSAPFVTCQNQTTLMVVRCVATTTQLTIAAVAFTANDVVNWVAISSK